MSTKRTKEQKIVVAERIQRILNAISSNSKMASQSSSETAFTKHMDNLKQSILILNKRLSEVKKETELTNARKGDDSKHEEEI